MTEPSKKQIQEALKMAEEDRQWAKDCITDSVEHPGQYQAVQVLAKALAAEREKSARLEKELERQRMRLVACGMPALEGNRPISPEYESASRQDVLRLLERAEAAESKLAEVTKERDNALDLAQIKTRETTALLQDRDRLRKERDVALRLVAEREDKEYQFEKDAEEQKTDAIKWFMKYEKALAKLKERDEEIERLKAEAGYHEAKDVIEQLKARAERAEAGMAAMLECLDEALSMTRDHSERCSTGFANGCSCGNSEAKIRWSKALASDAGPVLAELEALRKLSEAARDLDLARIKKENHVKDSARGREASAKWDHAWEVFRMRIADVQKAEAAGKNK